MRKFIKITVVFTVAIGILLAFNYKKIKRLYKAIFLFEKEQIVDNFRNMDAYFDVTRLDSSDNPYHIPKKTYIRLLDTFSFKGKQFNTEKFLTENQLEGLMIIHNDSIVYETYRKGFTPNDTHIAWSISKSIVSTLLGIAYDKGLFQLYDPITKYLPQFKGTGYDGVKIKDILQMSSGVGFNEDYGDFNSDINRFGRVFALGSSLEDFSKTLKREKTPGTYNHYVSVDTQVLGMLLKKVTGKTLTQYYKETLWNPLGMEDKCEWVIDSTGMEVALGGINMTLRDFAKIGLLYLHNGKFNDTQIVSEQWVKMATTPDAPHLKPGKQSNSDNVQGYGFQWWIPKKDEGDFLAAGIYDQYIYVQPNKKIVVVALSANYHFKYRNNKGENKHIALFKAISSMF